MVKKGVKQKVKKKIGSKSPWFRKRKNAVNDKWGFIPINWIGWVSLILLIVVNVFASWYFNLKVLDGKEWVKFGIVFLLSMLVFILIAKSKTLLVKDDL